MESKHKFELISYNLNPSIKYRKGNMGLYSINSNYYVTSLSSAHNDFPDTKFNSHNPSLKSISKENNIKDKPQIDSKQPKIPEELLKNLPFSTVVSIESEFTFQTITGSGVLVGPRHVLTVCQNIYHKEHKLAQRIKIKTSLNIKNQLYSAFANKIIIFNTSSSKEPTKEDIGTDSYDFALLILDESLGYQFGWMRMISFNNKEELEQLSFNITGYLKEQQSNEIYNHSGEILRYDSEYVNYKIKINTFGISKGSVVWTNMFWLGDCLIGMHLKENKDKLNVGCRLTKLKLDLLIKFINETWDIESKTDKKAGMVIENLNPDQEIEEAKFSIIQINSLECECNICKLINGVDVVNNVNNE